MKLASNRPARAALIALCGLLTWLVVVHSGLVGDYVGFVVVAIAYFAVVTMAVSMLAGYCGIWPIGHTAFTATGAYLTVNLGLAGLPIEAIVPIAVVTAAVIGYLLGMTAGRFSILYFGLLTLALSLAAFEVIGRWDQFTGGEHGIVVPAIPSLLAGRPIGLTDATGFTLIVATVAFMAVDLVCRGPVGRRWLAIKSQRIASMACGFVPPRENATAFGFSAGLAAMSGCAMAIAIGYLDPEGFSLNAGVTMLVATVVGGTGSILGAIFGAAFIVGVPELARGTSNVAPFIYGGAMILVLLFLRKGVVPSIIELLSGGSRGARMKAAGQGAARGGDLAALVADVLPNRGSDLVIEDVSVAFGGVKALQNVSITVPAGRAIGLIGPNGSGKTTLLNVLSGFVKPKSVGTLKVGSVDLQGLAPWVRIEAGFGRTFQHAELFGELTIRDALRVVARQGRASRLAAGRTLVDADAVAERIIAGLGLGEVADSKPHFLPFGIQKVADIARALAGGAGVLALDEPFSGLDADESAKLRAILRELRQAGVTILIIDHVVHEIFDLAESVYVLDFGSVIAHGTPAEIRANPKVREAYFGITETAEAQHA
ncbi:MAG: branched-chain amino acid ABC transporter permease [Alphaproteobacteria bacterium]|nr:MAG: branched-chain amino acid ABC transporter permease [Alphaproteobacteria bacterium]